MKPFVAMIVILALLIGCAQPNATPPTTSQSAESQLSPVAPSPTFATEERSITENDKETTHMAKEQLSDSLKQTILEAVSTEQNVPVDQLEITAAEAADWPDACLGLAKPDEMCAQMMTPGWAVMVTKGGQTWQYRTDLDALQVRLADG